MYIGELDWRTMQAFLSGVQLGMHGTNAQLPMACNQRAKVRRGWEETAQVWPMEEMRERGLDDAAMAREMLEIDILAWEFVAHGDVDPPPAPLSLDSPRWAELRTAYRLPAHHIPAQLAALSPGCHGVDEEAWHELWQDLLHQGDADTATYAALPHLVRLAEGVLPSNGLLWLITSIEVARGTGRGPAVPDDLLPAYEAAMTQVSAIVRRQLGGDFSTRTLRTERHERFCWTSIALLAAVERCPVLADTLLDMSSMDLKEVRIALGMDGED